MANNEVIVKPHDIFKSVFMQGAREKNGQLEVDLIDLQVEERLASLKEFADSINENREPETSGKDNLRSLAMVLGAVESVKTGKSVLIEDILNQTKASSLV
ncbi:hypothetical protein NDK43_14175 [Neobacillus pocheonensis]|uniref:Uncharacterized protein n=1 Tax=Neobacillus pocheonensis TaxID=363869 RepID=A0ABT0WAI4_9BACI|nr:hypothetical protein [Neobacillus pocheonensis]